MKKLLTPIFILLGLSAYAQESNFFKVIDNDSADQFVDAVQSANGDYFILSNSSLDSGDFKVTKTNGLGETDWVYSYGSSSEEKAKRMIFAADGGLYVVGTTYGVPFIDAEFGFVSKLSSTGAIEWTRYLGDTLGASANDIVIGRTGELYVTGYLDTDSLGRNILLARLSSSGSISWVRTYGGEGDYVGAAIAQDSRSNVILAGKTNSDSINIGSSGDEDIFVMSVNQLGDVVDGKNYGTINNDYAVDLAIRSNRIFVGGNTEASSLGGTDVFLLELDTNLVDQNSAVYGSFDDDKLSSVYLPNSGDPYVIYSGPSSFSQRDITAFRASFTNLFGINGSSVGGFDLDGENGAKMTGTSFLGLSVISSGNSFGGNTEGLYITKLDERLSVSCNLNLDPLSGSNVTFQSNNFKNRYDIGFGNNIVFTRATELNKDSTLCCTLEALVSNDSLIICEGESAELGRNNISGYVYNWTSISGDDFSGSSSNPRVSPTQSTEYKLVVSSTDGVCLKDSANVYVTVNPRQTIPEIRDTFFCENGSVQLTAQSGLNFYEWTQGNIISNSQSFNATVEGQVNLMTIDNLSCIYYDTIYVSSVPVPTFSLGNDTIICDNESLILTGPGQMDEYVWNGVPGSRDLQITTANDYILEVVDTNGCQASDTLRVLTNPSSSFSLGADTTICENEELVIFIPGALSDYTWNGQASANSEFTVTMAGTYIATAQNSFDCIARDTIVVSTLALPVFSLGSDTGFCEVISYQLAGPNGLSEYLWSDSSELPLLNVSTAGEYSLRVIDNNGCSFSDTVNIELYQSPTVDLGDDRDIPQSGVLVLDAGDGYVSYDWSSGEMTQTIQVSDTGTYSVTVIDENGCSGSDEVYIPKNLASIQLINGVEYRLFPNPAQNILNITTTANFKGADLFLIDFAGKEVMNQQIWGSTSTLDIANLANGVYKLVLKQADESLYFNVVIAK